MTGLNFLYRSGTAIGLMLCKSSRHVGGKKFSIFSSFISVVADQDPLSCADHHTDRSMHSCEEDSQHRNLVWTFSKLSAPSQRTRSVLRGSCLRYKRFTPLCPPFLLLSPLDRSLIWIFDSPSILIEWLPEFQISLLAHIIQYSYTEQYTGWGSVKKLSILTFALVKALTF